MLRFITLICLAVAAFCLPPQDLSRIHQTVATLVVTNGAPDGTWRADEMCPSGTYATGFELNVSRNNYV